MKRKVNKNQIASERTQEYSFNNYLKEVFYLTLKI